LNAYLNTLIREGALLDFDQYWLRQQIEEGLASPNAGELTEEHIRHLVSEGIGRAKSKG
jgi:hypothetical protein